MSSSELDTAYMSASRGYKLITISSVLVFAMITAVGARIIARRMKNIPLHLDDYLIMPALLFSTALCIMTILAVPLVGLGRHIEAAVLINSNAAGIIRRINFAHHVLSYCGAIVCAKLSVLVFYNRVFRERWIRYASYLVSGTTIALGIAVFISPFVVCNPMSWIFDGLINDGQCIHWQWYLTWLSLPNIITDTALLLIPLPVVWRLNLTNWQKTGLTFAFTLGGLNIVASCIRFYAFWDWASHTSTDTSWHAVEPATWVTVEASTLVVAACFPHLRPLVSRLVPKPALRDAAAETDDLPKGILKPFKILARKFQRMKDAHLVTKRRSLVARKWDSWRGIVDADDESYNSDHENNEKRTVQWIQDLESGLGSEKGWLPEGVIIMTEEVEVVVSESRDSGYGEIT